jgi:hypothetical protein
MGVPADLVRIHNYRDLIRRVARKVVAITRITGSDGPRSRGRELQLASSSPVAGLTVPEHASPVLAITEMVPFGSNDVTLTSTTALASPALFK